MPTPKPGEETKDEWMARCVPKVLEDGAAKDQDQAVAMCSSMWEQATKNAEGVIHRAYSVLEVRAVKEDQRTIRGVATTPQPDRLGDIVEPLGINFTNPSPLLWQHRADEPVGLVKFDKPTKNGMTFEATLPKVEEPGTLKDRVDEAWQSIKLGLVRAVSIGFRALERSVLKDGGIRFIETEVLELSLVTIPAQADARIETIKSIDRELLTLSGTKAVLEPAPDVSGKSETKPATRSAKGMSKTIEEQIQQFENSRAAKMARMSELMAKAADESQTLDNAESEEHDQLEEEVKKIDEHLVRLRAHAERNKTAAKPVIPPKDASQASDQRSGYGIITVKANVPPEIPFVRYAMALMAGKGSRMEALDIVRGAKAWHNTPEVELALTHDVQAQLKAAVSAGTTLDANFAAPLVAYTQFAAAFVEYLRPATIIGRIPGLRRVPFNIQIPRQTGGSSAAWVGEQAPKPVSSLIFDTITMRWAKAAAIVVLTEELVRFSNPSAEAIVRDDMRNASAEFLDRQFIDPSVAAVTNVSPASITNGVTPVTASGTTAAAFRADIKSLYALLTAANQPTTNAVWIMHPTTAVALALMMNSLGQPVFPTITPTGGTLFGYPVIVSQNVPATGSSPTDGYPIILALADQILLADDGGVTIDASREASLQMDSAPDSPPSASTNMLSLWQTNHVGLRAERFINWAKARTTSVQYISNAKYSE